MWNASLDEARTEIKIAQRNINNLRYPDDKSLLMKVKEESEKNWLKTQHSKKWIGSSGPFTSWKIDGETKETVTDFTFWTPKSLLAVTTAMKLKDACFLEEKLWQT